MRLRKAKTDLFRVMQLGRDGGQGFNAGLWVSRAGFQGQSKKPNFQGRFREELKEQSDQ